MEKGYGGTDWKLRGGQDGGMVWAEEWDGGVGVGVQCSVNKSFTLDTYKKTKKGVGGGGRGGGKLFCSY